MKFSKVQIGQKFIFSFDLSFYERELAKLMIDHQITGWIYEKISKFRVKCVGGPKTESEDEIGKIWDFTDPEVECILLE